MVFSCFVFPNKLREMMDFLVPGHECQVSGWTPSLLRASYPPGGAGTQPRSRGFRASSKALGLEEQTAGLRSSPQMIQTVLHLGKGNGPCSQGEEAMKLSVTIRASEQARHGC